MDDYSAPPPGASSSRILVQGLTPSADVPRTIPGDPDRPLTQYTPPVPAASTRDVGPPLPSDPHLPSSRSVAAHSAPHRSRILLIVAVCFVLGGALGVVAWKMGRFGANGDDEERVVARATDAMFKNHFVDPPGDNVRDITDEGFKRWPNDRKLLDIRQRASNELVTKAQGQRAAGDVLEALKVARSAQDLDPTNASAKHLVEQYEVELASFSPTTSPTLPASTQKGPPTTALPLAQAQQGYKVLLDLSAPAPRVGQTVDLTARVAPSKGSFDGAAFVISGPTGVATMGAQSQGPGVFKGSYAFLEGGRYEVAFTTQADGKPLRATRAVVAGAPPPPSQPQATQAPPTPPQPTQPLPPSSPSVKWM
jgi:hypothetical protein